MMIDLQILVLRYWFRFCAHRSTCRIIGCLFVFQSIQLLFEYQLSTQYQSEDGCIYATKECPFFVQIAQGNFVQTCRLMWISF